MFHQLCRHSGAANFVAHDCFGNNCTAQMVTQGRSRGPRHTYIEGPAGNGSFGDELQVGRVGFGP